ncbi:hypothetical protein AC578_861 [Pseudocercospora eumusae]|uniref:Uncharacterized protein n=1 Tax=Pseudocercospora eumusae TaxID=321146 RepID=A0A139H405_9PEZI|nr:hypothetical protein AC578_861 [Pseudocercospora eumusae]
MSSDTISVKEEARQPTASEEAEIIARSRLFDAGAVALTEFTSRLGGGGFGDLRIEGSKANGHEQLFALRDLLQKIQADMNKTSAKCSHLEEDIESECGTPSRKTSKMSNKHAKTLEGVVERQTSDKFRDISIKFENLAEQMEKSKKETSMLGEEIDRLKEKVRKRAVSTVDQNARSEDQHRAIVKRVERLEKGKKSSNLDARVGKVEERIDGEVDARLAQLDTQMNQQELNARLFSSRIQNLENEQRMQAEKQLEAKVDGLSSDNKDLAKQVWDLGLAVDSAIGTGIRAERRAIECERKISGLGGKVDGLASMGTTFEEQFNDLEERVGGLDSSVELGSLADKADSHIGCLDKRLDRVEEHVKAFAEQLATSRRPGWVGWLIRLMRGSRFRTVSGSDVYHDIC